ncbi:putative aldo-keto reductase (AKR) [Aspergillus brunneoviolaceus CBS 621.78]|uniref:Aldo/keto reductase n=1 Tax=Aspergillus brunneoviolaceus CBS 621.78 TaxID=1450534 RepID=A0ACD1GJ43_9EURO|nr:Aldo/keto reductase [Aspergillus brunneoviolaceus CBS 621.78]RAH49364.1 Aldo/keto reductase [Aspergillus brunneoviolaceus CBS 621.78]
MARAAISKMSWENHVLRPVQNAPPSIIPTLIYGTAWKKTQTTDLVHQALSTGFRAVDTAAQPKHYREDLVGEGIRRALNDGAIQRKDLHIQTKFTSVRGQDPKDMPYDPQASVTEQVHASIRSSLHNLRPAEAPESADEAYLDMLILHSPLPTMAQTLEAWQTFETYVPHRIRNLGISNTDLSVLKELFTQAQVKPSVVQNRFYADTEYDVALRAFCREQHIVYQSFWTLTANPDLVHSNAVQSLARRAELSPAAALYCLVLGLGYTTVLDGTTNTARMEEDSAALAKIERFSGAQPEEWQEILAEFRLSIGE